MNIKHIASAAAFGFAAYLFSSNTLPAAASSTNDIRQWLEGKNLPRINSTQAEAFAQQHQRRPEALLGAYQASNERGFFREAMARFPRDPRVALAAACGAGSPANTETTQGRREWLDTFKLSAPGNALALYLSAGDHFKSGQPDLAEQEVLTANTKPMKDYAADWLENAEDAYRSAGYSEPESKVLAASSLLIPHLAKLRDLGTALVSRANIHRQAGKEAAANKLLQVAITLGQQLDRMNSLTILENLVGINIQQSVLKGLDPTSRFGGTDETVQAQIDQLAERRNTIRTMARQFNEVLITLSAKDIGNFFEQQRRLGEAEAERQFLAKRGI